MTRHSGMSRLWAGIIATLVIGGLCYLVFGGGLPFSGARFKLRALFTAQTQLHIPSKVRIAGADVGQVLGISRIPGSNAAVVQMEIDPNGLPIHADATAKIRPHIFLEGNFYVDLHPGSSSAPILASGATLSAASTSGPVQLDRVLSALNSDSRSNLQTLLRGLGDALYSAPGAGGLDRSQDPLTRSLSGGQALNQSLRFSVDAFRASSIVNQSLLGSSPNDLAKVIQGNQQILRAFAAAGSQLPSLVTTFNATMATLASRQQQLSQTIAVLPALLRRAQTSDSALDASFPPTEAFAREILPGVRQTDSTIRAALPWLAQATALSSPRELQGLLRDLTPAVQNTARSLNATRGLLVSSAQLARCFSHNLVPAGDQVITDPPVGSGLRVYQEFFQSAVGLAGAAGNFDGNGRYIRASAGGGALRLGTPSLPQNGPLYGNFVAAPLGTRPAYAGSPPPVRRDVPCAGNPVPRLNSARTGTAP